jgi:hypothetical protein
VIATRIMFAQGDATDMFNAVRVLGRLKPVILEERSRPLYCTIPSFCYILGP